jgi:Na+-translocating ferredoxin:NAD+ oxidoreductase RnfA subunit
MAGIPLTVVRPPEPPPPPIHRLLLNGILAENPVFRLALSLCPAVAVTTTVWNGIILGIAVLLVQVLSSSTVALLHGRIHPRVRIPAYTIIIAVWVSAIDMVLAAFFPALYAQVGLYVKLIVAFAIIISRLEMFASRHPLVPSFFDGLGMGLGFLLALVAIAALRELLGAGSLLGFRLLPAKPLLFFALPAGGFFSIALFMALFNAVERRRGGKAKRPAAGAHGVAAGVLAAAALLAPADAAAAPVAPAIEHVRLLAPDHVRVTVSAPLADPSAANFRWTEAGAPDLPVAVRAVRDEGGGRYLLTLDGRVDPGGRYRLEIADPPLGRDVRPSPWALVFGILLSSALINNFVFTRYLGLCVFFGVSKKRETAIGMGFTFAAVMVLSAVLSWALFTWVLKPLSLGFLQVLVFIGIVAFLVQLLDTVLKKTHPDLHKKFGIYLVLITTNCIILAVPLLNAEAGSGAVESLALAVGSGAGFALALFLMSCARERVELARVPESFKGLPIAFLLAGLFALAFMGFSGLDFNR